jgi:hypothetical protein
MYKVEMEVLLNVSCRGVQAIVKSKEADTEGAETGFDVLGGKPSEGRAVLGGRVVDGEGKLGRWLVDFSKGDMKG